MKKIISLYCCLLSLMFGFNTKAQILPFSYENTEFTLINPSSFGQINGIELGLINRSRFINSVSNARTSGFLFNTSFDLNKSEKNKEHVNNPMGIGAIFLNGTSNTHQVNEISLNYSYRFPISLKKTDKYLEYTKKSSLTKLNISFGISASLQYVLNQYDELYYDETRSGIDPLVQESVSSKLLPNIGVGLKLDNHKFAVSFSLPKLLDENNKLNLENVRFNTRVEVILTNNLKMYPMAGVSIIKYFAQTYKFGCQFFALNDYGVGVLGKNNNSVELSLHFIHPNKRLRANYYFSVLSNFQDIGAIALPVHELSVFYELAR